MKRQTIVLLSVLLMQNPAAKPLAASQNTQLASVVGVHAVRSVTVNPPIVTAVADTVHVDANSTGNELIFFVENTNPTNTTYSFSCSFTSPVSSCTRSPTSYNFPPYDQIDVSVFFNAGSPGTGLVWLTAGGKRDTVVVIIDPVAAPAAPTVDVVNANPGTLLDRGSCITSAAGAASAFQMRRAAACSRDACLPVAEPGPNVYADL